VRFGVGFIEGSGGVPILELFEVFGRHQSILESEPFRPSLAVQSRHALTPLKIMQKVGV
jgi:hypothetical protein